MLSAEDRARYVELATGPIETMTVGDVRELVELMVKNGELEDLGDGRYQLPQGGGYREQGV